jgi:acetyl-CoA carboxylase carboxyltransferase component
MNTVNAQNTSSEKQTKETVIKNLIDSKNYVFTAKSVHPQSSSIRHLTSEYDMKVMGDSIVTYLPYFGRAYSAPVNLSQGGIQFTSTDFNYTIDSKRKEWIIVIKPRESIDVRELTLRVFKNGSASLMVNSTNRQSISYNGVIEARRSK